MAKDHTQELNDLLDIVSKENASDLHLAAGRKPHIRVNNELIPLANRDELSKVDMHELLKLLVSADKVDDLAEKTEIDFSYEHREDLRLRGNAYMQSDAITIALRSIEPVRELAELNLPELLKEFAFKQQGFFLLVGPVGVGKSTTMAALIELINKERKEHIVTIEHPVEHRFIEKNSIIDQREVGIDTHSFETGLNSVFRQDVDVIMIGEMRTKETIATAVTAAETGHLVLSTLHTNNAAQTIDRVIDSFPGEQQDQIRTQLAGSLLGIFSQRLIPSLRGGLVPAYELMINNSAVSNLIREARTHELDTIIETGFESGMISMNRSLADLVRNGDISVENAMKFSINPEGLQALL